MTLIEAARARLSAIVLGVLLGILARYGVMTDDSHPPTRRDFAVDALTFGVLVVITIQLADEMKLDRGGCVAVGVAAGLSGTKLVRWFRDRFLRQISASSDVAQLADAARAADIAKVPAGSGLPDEIGAHSGTPDDPKARTGAALQGAFRKPTITRPPADQIELLRKLDAPPADNP